MMKSPTLIFSLTLLAFLSEVQAHYLWMERDEESKIRVFFGEYQEGLREKTVAVLIKETDRPVADLRAYDIGIVKPIYYTRIHPKQQSIVTSALLDLDLLPISFERGEFQGKQYEAIRHRATLTFIR